MHSYTNPQYAWRPTILLDLPQIIIFCTPAVVKGIVYDQFKEISILSTSLSANSDEMATKLLFHNCKAPNIIFDSWYSGSGHALWLGLWWKELDMVGAVGKWQ